MAQAQLFGKGNELHLGFVLVGTACCLKELTWGGCSVSGMWRGPHTPCGIPGTATPSPATSALPPQAQTLPTHIKAHAQGPVPTLRPRSGGRMESSSACRMRSGQDSTCTLRVASTMLRSHPGTDGPMGASPAPAKSLTATLTPWHCPSEPAQPIGSYRQRLNRCGVMPTPFVLAWQHQAP